MNLNMKQQVSEHVKLVGLCTQIQNLTGLPEPMVRYKVIAVSNSLDKPKLEVAEQLVDHIKHGQVTYIRSLFDLAEQPKLQVKQYGAIVKVLAAATLTVLLLPLAALLLGLSVLIFRRLTGI